MKLPKISEPERYRGLYVYDFGEWVAVGYTVAEIVVLLESEEHADGKVYQIVRAQPDGGMELRGVSAERFQKEAGLFFNRDELADAEADFAELCRIADEPGRAIPCRAFVQVADRGAVDGAARYVTALIYPAEYDDEVSRWLMDHEYAGGTTVESGPSHVSNYYAEQVEVLQRRQLWNRSGESSRSPEEVLRTVRRAVQR